MKHPWFKSRTGGFSLYPATWQGWLVIVALAAGDVWNFLRLDSHSHSVSDTLRPFLIQTLGTGLVYILICILTGEKSRFRRDPRRQS